MSSFVVCPDECPITFPASEGWHKDDRDVTMSAVQLFTAFHLLKLAAKGMEFRPASSPVRFFNQTFGRKLSATRWQAILGPVVEEVREALAFRNENPGNCLTAEAD
jgi:hypothetical protein